MPDLTIAELIEQLYIHYGYRPSLTPSEGVLATDGSFFAVPWGQHHEFCDAVADLCNLDPCVEMTPVIGWLFISTSLEGKCPVPSIIIEGGDWNAVTEAQRQTVARIAELAPAGHWWHNIRMGDDEDGMDNTCQSEGQYGARS